MKEFRENNWRIGMVTRSGLINLKEGEEYGGREYGKTSENRRTVTSLLSLDRVVGPRVSFIFFFFFRTNIKKFKWRILTSDVIFDRVFQRTVILKKRNGI